MRRQVMFVFCCLFLWMSGIYASPYMRLKDNLPQANPGDYIVTAQNKNYSILMIYNKTPSSITMEEVTVPDNKIPRKLSWKDWFQDGAPGNTAWIRYEIDTTTGTILNTFSFTRNSWCKMNQADQFLSTLLNLPLAQIPLKERKRVGQGDSFRAADNRPLWQPRMVVDGQPIDNVAFDAWRTRWPNDGTSLAGKTIEVYVPENNTLYPSYFPYWLQISGMIGKAKIRIIDSGTDLRSPRPTL